MGETGGPGRWRDLPDWPPSAAAAQVWHLHGGGAADPEAGDGAGQAPGTDPGGGRWSGITVPMSATAHRFGAGHRLRLQISGGAHPRFARNTGTGEPLATATRLVAVDIDLGHGPGHPSLLRLPAAPPGPDGAAR